MGNPLLCCHTAAMAASMGKLYVAFHELTGLEMPAGTIDPHVRYVVTCYIVHSAVKMAYEQYSDPESEEKTPEDYANGHAIRLMDMPPEQWWDEIVIFPSEAVVANQGLFDLLPAEHPPFP